jgi:hypothetical protein
LLQFLANAIAQIFWANFKHLPTGFGHPQVVIPRSACDNSAITENQWKELEEELRLGGVLAEISPNCGQHLFAG